ncbi:M56 family metallopeptidase [Marinicrinis lubricantis]|uniref:M56 family metallopeptidase n=1 Tax=Marinicrinis lubricantis TaxID=2086470 RepID=A0ABW1IN58_9BACL
MEQVVIILNQIFQWVLTTSAMASVMVGLILLAKFLLKDKLNIRWHYLLWILVIIRLILPWTPESSFSVFNLVNLETPLIEGDQQSTFSENSSYEVTDPILSTNNLENVTETSYFGQSKHQEVASENQTVSWISFIMLAWVLGIIFLFMYIFVSHRNFVRKVNSGALISDRRILQLFDQCKHSMHVRKNISLIKTNVINSPTLYGSIHPRLLLPEDTLHTFTNKELTYIFFHELAHFKRKDIPVNWLMTSLLILHWFNPILWYGCFRMREDQEMACDALALSFINPNESTHYGYTIIKLLENYSRSPSTPGVANFSGNKSQLKRRINMIALFKKKSIKWTIVTILLVFGIGLIGLTNPTSESELYKEIDKMTDYTIISTQEKEGSAVIELQVLDEAHSLREDFIQLETKIILDGIKHLPQKESDRYKVITIMYITKGTKRNIAEILVLNDTLQRNDWNKFENFQLPEIVDSYTYQPLAGIMDKERSQKLADELSEIVIGTDINGKEIKHGKLSKSFQNGISPSTTSIFELSEHLLSVYQQFSKTKSNEALNGIEPIDIVRLYYYTEFKAKDYETLYYLHVQDEEKYVIPPKDKFIEEAKSNTAARKMFLEELENNLVRLEQIYNNGNEARIEHIYNGEISSKVFQLVKENGVWKAHWLPLQ